MVVSDEEPIALFGSDSDFRLCPIEALFLNIV
jgi:hypothetical protein